MAIELIEHIDGFRQLEPEWNTALNRSPHSGPFLTYEWLLSYLEAFGDESQLFLVVVRRDTKIAGLAPLIINHDRQLVFIGHPHADYTDFIIVDKTPGVLDEIIDFLQTHRSRWDKMILDQMQEDLSHWKELDHCLSQRNWPHRLLLSDTCPAMVLDDIEAATKKYYKRNIRKYVNWYKKQGDFAFNVYRDKDTALARLEDLFQQHIDRRDQTAFVSQFNDKTTKQFYRAFVNRLHDMDCVHIMSLTLDDLFLALYITFEYNNTLFLYTTSFNPIHAQHSPGQTILRFLFDYSVEHSLDQMDLARGDEDFKDRFANVMRQNRKLIVYNSRLSRQSADLFHAFRYSRLVDLLYRNKRVQIAKLIFLYERRKHGLAQGIAKSLQVLLARRKKKG